MNWSPYNKPKKRGSQRSVASSENNTSSIVALFGICVLLGFLFVNGCPRVNPTPNPTDDTVIVEPDKDGSNIVLADTYLVRVYETETQNMPASMVKMLNDDAFWIEWFNNQKMRYFTFDPTSNPEQAVSFISAAKKRNISPPFYMHVRKGGAVLSVAPIKADTTSADIKKTILLKAK